MAGDIDRAATASKSRGSGHFQRATVTSFLVPYAVKLGAEANVHDDICKQPQTELHAPAGAGIGIV